MISQKQSKEWAHQKGEWTKGDELHKMMIGRKKVPWS